MLVTDVSAAQDNCNTHTGYIIKSDIVALSASPQNTNAWTTAYLPSLTYASWSVGTAKICVRNAYWFENTHVTRWEAGWATGYIYDQCCKATDNAQWWVFRLYT